MFTDVVEPAQGLKQVVASYSSSRLRRAGQQGTGRRRLRNGIQSWTDTADYYGNGDIRLKQQAAAELRSSESYRSVILGKPLLLRYRSRVGRRLP